MKAIQRRHNIIRRHAIAAAIIALCAMVSADAMELPVKTVNGRRMYYYTVSKGETVYSITHKLNITHDQLVSANRTVVDGLRAGQILYFPVDEFDDKISEAQTENDSSTPASIILHTVTKGETLYGVCHRYNVSANDIIRLNPGAENGLKAGQTLKIPNNKQTASNQAAPASDPDSGKKIEPLPEPEYQLTPVRPEIVENNTPSAQIAETEPAGQPLEQPAEQTVEQKNIPQRHSIAIMLPLNVGEDTKATRQSSLATDFYRGVLLAVNDYQATSGDSIDIHVYDTTKEGFAKVLTSSAVRSADAIISPDDDGILAKIAAQNGSKATPIFNSFIVKDSTYITTPGMMQSYINQERMYAKAIDYITDKLAQPGAPKAVILDNENGRKDKLLFVSQLKERLDREGITYSTINFDGNLHKNILEENLPTAESYFVITQSGALAEYNKIAEGLAAFAEDLTATGNTLTTFGYPEWITFRGEAQDKLSKIGAIYYSRFYADKENENAKRIIADFRRWFGKLPADGIPVQALLGYDTARYILTALHGGDIIMDETYYGVQSSYHFRQTPGIKGYINDALYIVQYIPGTTSPVITII